jgi:hypothetical protein
MMMIEIVLCFGSDKNNTHNIVFTYELMKNIRIKLKQMFYWSCKVKKKIVM